MDIKILIASHKEYWMPQEDMYLPIHVGMANQESIGYMGDDTGDHISYKNPNYCELTAAYWAWKNLEAKYIGLVHYRRHFAAKRYGLSVESKRNTVLSRGQLENVLLRTDIVLPNKRKYYIETNRSHYNHAHNKLDLDMTEQIIEELYPDYKLYFHIVMNRTWAHMFNMFIMEREKFHAYCKWLFSILFTLEKRIDISTYDSYQARVFGFISELLLDVWIEKNQFAYKEIDFVFMEHQNWLKKGYLFLERKYRKR
ncbi:hypothetical protein P22_0559 [Propionispora sp. 2/2-37]|uniref:DUF4422 domain-containing protein n=1 Tax=Propionispora sp. 2/2-37 TaxID=1677858 RepID=UPI0006BB55C1|nr:DUF4422 domain-containing protein [Propionispora sp. 2/2-37]CUH94493.1 hypothetical protein P22_0559 [Propionispora sp. 2/2-37]